MAKIMNEENDWNHVEGDAVEGPVVYRLLSMIGIKVLAEICQKVLDGFRMPAEWALCSNLLPISWFQSSRGKAIS